MLRQQNHGEARSNTSCLLSSKLRMPNDKEGPTRTAPKKARRGCVGIRVQPSVGELDPAIAVAAFGPLFRDFMRSRHAPKSEDAKRGT